MSSRPRAATLSPAQIDTARRLRAAGYGPADIAWELGVLKPSLDAALGIPPTVRAAASWRPHDPERDERLVARYKELLESGNRRPLSEVGRQFGVTRERARQIVVGHELREGEKIERVHERRRRLAPIRPPAPTVVQRLLRHVRVEGECWIWTGATRKLSGRIRGVLALRGLGAYPERAAYKLWRGPLDQTDFLVPDEGCGEWLCINPWHRHIEAPAERFRNSPHWDKERGIWRKWADRWSQTRRRSR